MTFTPICKWILIAGFATGLSACASGDAGQGTQTPTTPTVDTPPDDASPTTPIETPPDDADTCGDGEVQDNEACDDGKDNGTPNHCNADCSAQMPAICGNQIIEEGETCDDGDDNGTPNHCNADCTAIQSPTCGNDAIENGEACDDGKDNGAPNHCNTTCSGQTAPKCGNGIKEHGEACDDGEDNGGPNHCNADCSGTQQSVCGNAVKEAGEICDDGAQTANCNADCTLPVCGDHIVNPAAGEQCDDGNKNGALNHCKKDCSGILLPNVCGNGIVEGWEQCDAGESMPTANCNRCRNWSPYDGDPIDLPNLDQWRYYAPPGAVCRSGSQAGYAVNVGADPERVMFYFEGGGACFEPANCLANPSTVIAQNPPASGIFDRNNPRNPFKDWTWVYFPYCSGDVFAGNNPTNPFIGAFGIDLSNGGTHFVGDANMNIFLDRAVPALKNAATIKQVASVGMSAGGISAVVNTRRIARAFPDARVTVVDDSGPPLPSSVANTCMQQVWNDLWNLGNTVLLDCGWACPQSNDFLEDFATSLVRDNERIDYGYFGFTGGDPNVIALFSFGTNSCGVLGVPTLVTPAALQNALHTLRADMHDASDRTAFYFSPAAGQHTCIPNSDCFYGMNIDGVGLPEWIGDLLNRHFADVGN